MSQYGFVARFQAGLTKLLPHSLVMDIWMRQQKLLKVKRNLHKSRKNGNQYK